MADGVSLDFDTARIDRDADRLVRRYLAAGTTAVSGTTRRLEKKLEAATQSAVPGKLWRAWQSSRFPEQGPARNPVGTIWLKGGTRTNSAIQFWTQPGVARGKQGQYLAIPLPAAGVKGRSPMITPADWERKHGVQLRFVGRPGRSALLVVDSAVLSGRRQVARPNTPRRIAAGRGSATVPVFVLVPAVKFRNAFSVAGMVQASEGELAQAFFAAVRGISAG